MTRTENSFFNFITESFSTVLVVVLNFVTRWVFIRCLGGSYLGIEGYFRAVLNMLSLTELGFGAAITYKLYKPIEEGDRRRIQVLMKLYRQVYAAVGWIILALGAVLIPFLPRLIRGYGDIQALGLSPVLIFLLYLFNSAASYWFFAYKIAFVTATQKSYVLTAAGYIITVAGSLAQIAVLALTRSYVLYVVVLLGQTLARNLLYAYICDRRHPYLKEKTADRVSREELRGFFKDCSALLLYRVNNVAIDGMDNVVLTGLVGLAANGIYANYLSVRVNLCYLLDAFLEAVRASLGSLYSTGNLDWSRLIFRVVHFASAMLYGLGGIGIAVLADDFITLWLGPGWTVTSWTAGGRTVGTPLAVLVGIQVFVAGVSYCHSIFREAMGLFRELKYRPLASMAVNLITCLWLVPRIGIAGCAASTVISIVTTNLIVDPIVICRCALKISPRGYFIRNGLYTLATAAAGLLSWRLCRLIPLGGVAGFLVHGLVCVAATSGVYALCFFRTAEFRYLVRTALELLRRRGRDEPEGE